MNNSGGILMNVIEAKKLNRSFVNGKEVAHVLKDIDLTVEEGEFVSIMGPSGGGKSTLLYLLGGLDMPSSGTVTVNGVDLSKLKDKELCKMRNEDVGFVFQFYNLVPNLNVEDNISLPLMISGKTRSEYKDKLDECLKIIGMEDKRKLTPRELSGGQQQRVAIARSLVFDPKILFLDEPIGNLDTKTGLRIMQLFKDINQKYGKTIVQVTHSETAAKFGTKLVRLVDGTIESVSAISQN
jgi:putative ABC transport system ATP-binding protein